MPFSALDILVKNSCSNSRKIKEKRGGRSYSSDIE
jgi:hypothetical protein